MYRASLILLNPFKARVGLHLAESEMKVIRLQLRRIREDMAMSADAFKKVRVTHHLDDSNRERFFDDDFREAGIEAMKRGQEVNTTLFADIKFLVMSVRQLRRFFMMIRKYLPNEPELEELEKRYGGFLKDSKDIRNGIVHEDDRIDDGVSDLGNLYNSKFTFDGKEFEIGPELERILEEFFEGLLQACEFIAERQRTEAAGCPRKSGSSEKRP
jgi:hypothetical protein